MSDRPDFMSLTRTGADTPMGRLLRRYWIPAVMAPEVEAPGGAPVRVRLLGERLVCFRSPQGQLGLVREFCPHRGASLAYARNEQGGLRCLYHGWLVAPDGEITQTPAEPDLSKRFCHPSYPVREAGGLVWTYMGPAGKRPPFPNFSWMGLKPPHLLVAKLYQSCNYMQGVEGDLDPAHPNYLHRDLDREDKASWAGAGWNSIQALMHDGAPVIHCEHTPYLMRVGAVRTTPDPEVSYVRVFEYCAPFYCFIPAGPGESQLFKAWHPIDDYSCYTFYIHYDADKPLDAEAIHRNWGHRTAAPDYKSAHDNTNMHLQDRARMNRNLSGIEGAAIQDLAMQESMGPLYDRSQEHLGASDRAVIFYRHTMMKLMETAEQGGSLPGQDAALDYKLRAASTHMPKGEAWQLAASWLEREERGEISWSGSLAQMARRDPVAARGDAS